MVTFKNPKGVMWFWEYNEDTSTNKPIIIFLPGSGERSDTPNFGLIEKNGLPKLLKQAGLTFLDGFTVLAPQQTRTASGYIRDPKNPDIIKFLKYVHENYQSKYIMPIGLSMGGSGSWFASYLGTEKLVTAIVPVSAGEGDYNLAKLTEQRGIKVWGIHGSNDTISTVSDGKRPINGVISVGGEPKWTLIQGGGHNSLTWDIAFSITDRPELGGTTIYKWFASMCEPVEKPGIYVNNIWYGYDSCDFQGNKIEFRN